MVDAFVQGMKAIPSRVNPQSLHPVAFATLHELRLAFLERKGARGFVAKEIALALQEIYKTQEDKFLSVMVELVTVVLLAGRDAKLGLEPVFRFILLGNIRAMIDLGFPEDKLERMLEQVMIAIFMSPVYEFAPEQFQRLAYLTKRFDGEILALHYVNKTFSSMKLMKIREGIHDGFEDALELIDVDAIKKEDMKKTLTATYIGYLGLLDAVVDLWWFDPPKWFTKAVKYFSELFKKISAKKTSA